VAAATEMWPYLCIVEVLSQPKLLNGRDISWKSFQKISYANHSREKCGNSRRKSKWNGISGKKFQNNLVYLA